RRTANTARSVKQMLVEPRPFPKALGVIWNTQENFEGYLPRHLSLSLIRLQLSTGATPQRLLTGPVVPEAWRVTDGTSLFDSPSLPAVPEPASDSVPPASGSA